MVVAEPSIGADLEEAIAALAASLSSMLNPPLGVEGSSIASLAALERSLDLLAARARRLWTKITDEEPSTRRRQTKATPKPIERLEEEARSCESDCATIGGGVKGGKGGGALGGACGACGGGGGGGGDSGGDGGDGGDGDGGDGDGGDGAGGDGGGRGARFRPTE